MNQFKFFYFIEKEQNALGIYKILIILQNW